MKYLFFDTETTGLPIDRSPATKTDGIWPNIVSIAWILADDDSTILHSEYNIVKPKGWIIPEESIAIHKINQTTAEKYGIELKTVIDRFLWYVNECDVIVAHNLYFDKNVINNALKWQLGRSLMLDDYKKRMFCTMQNGRPLVGIPSKTAGKFKSPKLSEMYKEVFGVEPSGTLHNAMTDTQILMECFYKIWGKLDVVVNSDLPIVPVTNTIDASASAPVIRTLRISFDTIETV